MIEVKREAAAAEKVTRKWVDDWIVVDKEET
jgi:hypothetical protein